MIAQHGNDDYREKAISYLKSRAEGVSRLEEFYFSFVASRTIRAADWFISSECFSVTCVRNTLYSISVVFGCVFCESVATFSTQMISWHSEHLPKQ
jgi:hypothetical protein